MFFVSSYVPFTKLTSPSGTPIHLNVAIVISRGIASYESTNQSMNESMNLLAKLSDFCSRSLSPSHLSLPLSLFLSLSVFASSIRNSLLWHEQYIKMYQRLYLNVPIFNTNDYTIVLHKQCSIVSSTDYSQRVWMDLVPLT
jgi:hypothetical protein